MNEGEGEGEVTRSCRERLAAGRSAVRMRCSAQHQQRPSSPVVRSQPLTDRKLLYGRHGDRPGVTHWDRSRGVAAKVLLNFLSSVIVDEPHQGGADGTSR
jgi:hypothetical protein